MAVVTKERSLNEDEAKDTLEKARKEISQGKEEALKMVQSMIDSGYVDLVAEKVLNEISIALKYFSNPLAPILENIQIEICLKLCKILRPIAESNESRLELILSHCDDGTPLLNVILLDDKVLRMYFMSFLRLFKKSVACWEEIQSCLLANPNMLTTMNRLMFRRSNTTPQKLEGAMLVIELSEKSPEIEVIAIQNGFCDRIVELLLISEDPEVQFVLLSGLAEIVNNPVSHPFIRDNIAYLTSLFGTLVIMCMKGDETSHKRIENLLDLFSRFLSPSSSPDVTEKEFERQCNVESFLNAGGMENFIRTLHDIPWIEGKMKIVKTLQTLVVEDKPMLECVRDAFLTKKSNGELIYGYCALLLQPSLAYEFRLQVADTLWVILDADKLANTEENFEESLRYFLLQSMLLPEHKINHSIEIQWPITGVEILRALTEVDNFNGSLLGSVFLLCGLVSSDLPTQQYLDTCDVSQAVERITGSNYQGQKTIFECIMVCFKKLNTGDIKSKQLHEIQTLTSILRMFTLWSEDPTFYEEILKDTQFFQMSTMFTKLTRAGSGFLQLAYQSIYFNGSFFKTVPEDENELGMFEKALKGFQMGGVYTGVNLRMLDDTIQGATAAGGFDGVFLKKCIPNLELRIYDTMLELHKSYLQPKYGKMAEQDNFFKKLYERLYGEDVPIGEFVAPKAYQRKVRDTFTMIEEKFLPPEHELEAQILHVRKFCTKSAKQLIPAYVEILSTHNNGDEYQKYLIDVAKYLEDLVEESVKSKEAHVAAHMKEKKLCADHNLVEEDYLNKIQIECERVEATRRDKRALEKDLQDLDNKIIQDQKEKEGILEERRKMIDRTNNLQEVFEKAGHEALETKIASEIELYKYQRLVAKKQQEIQRLQLYFARCKENLAQALKRQEYDEDDD